MALPPGLASTRFVLTADAGWQARAFAGVNGMLIPAPDSVINLDGLPLEVDTHPATDILQEIRLIFDLPHANA